MPAKFLALIVVAVSALDFENKELRRKKALFHEQYDIFSENPVRTEDGEKLLEGDIVMPNDTEYDEMFKKSTFNLLSLWPFGNVSYNFHPSVSDKVKKLIKGALDYWEEHTCLNFAEKATDWWYLRFRTDRKGCWSYVGHQTEPLTGQDVSIGPGCETHGIILHEVGHAIGIFHEQSRSDRDGYVKVLWDNMIEGTGSQFRSVGDVNYGVEYDVSSIMHYGPMSFSQYPFEKNTIVSKDPHLQRLMGTLRDLTFRDKKIVNRMYNCDFFCPNKDELPCKNGGYASPYRNDGRPCRCICPPRVTGVHCEEKIGDYYDPPPCGGDVKEEKSIETLNYPERKYPYESCSWLIQAPKGKKISVLFEDFSFHKRLDRPGHKYHNLCTYERVEIRTENRYQGKMYCGTDISPGTEMTSKSDFFIIIIHAAKFPKGRGLKAKISFIQ